MSFLASGQRPAFSRCPAVLPTEPSSPALNLTDAAITSPSPARLTTLSSVVRPSLGNTQGHTTTPPTTDLHLAPVLPVLPLLTLPSATTACGLSMTMTDISYLILSLCRHWKKAGGVWF